MPELPTNLRRDLERAIVKARDVAEAGARVALEALTVHEGKPGGHLDGPARALRLRLRAHARQLGDKRNKRTDAQQIDHLVHECAYEHWHRMLFARFLAENDLLVEPESGVSVTLDEVEELAREAKANPWELASRFAQGMLPQIFRPDDAVLAVALPMETRVELESLLEELPRETFTADDSLGWVYQFWQTQEKKRVNESGEKITGDTLPAVTQLFTEHYMVLFLLHNTLGAWWAGKKLTTEDTESTEGEEELRKKVSLRGVDWEYLRFVRDGGPRADSAQNSSSVSSVSSVVNSPDLWRPAAGTFDGWPLAAAELKVLDPCCGSGHFLVAAFELLARLRMDEEGLSAEDAARAVLRDNLFGLEIDQRCTQIAAFALAMAAWKLAGRVIELPPMQIACSGIGPSATLEEWLKLAEQAEHTLSRHAREPVRNGLENLHRLFSQAPELGSLIDPTELPSDMFAADYETLQPFLDEVFKRESADVEMRERAVAAQGMAKAADLLAGEYQLVITNVPYLGRGKQGEILKAYLEERYNEAKADIATALVLRCLELCGRDGTTALVTPQNWLFLTSYKKLRESLLKGRQWDMVARLGPGAFETIGGHVVNVALLALSDTRPSAAHVMSGIDVSAAQQPEEKAALLRGDQPADLARVPQAEQLKNPDAVVSFEPISGALLSNHTISTQGLKTGDDEKWRRTFWEIDWSEKRWKCLQSSIDATTPYGGRESVIDWLSDGAQMARLQGMQAWNQVGVAVKLMGLIPATLYTGEIFDSNISPITPTKESSLAAVWAFCETGEFSNAIRRLNSKLNIAEGSVVKVPFDLAHWQKVAAEKYPNGLPEPESDDATQWLFHGRPEESTLPLQVAVARLLGYRWPAELDDEMRLSHRARELVGRCEELLPLADPDGIVCLPAVRSEATAADRLRKLLAAAYQNPHPGPLPKGEGVEWSAGTEADLLAAVDCRGLSLDEWLRSKFFEQHCQRFHHRPFVWHIWDGRKDGFHALVNYHKLAAPDGAGRKLLETLTYSYLGNWITRQQHGVRQDEPGAEARLAAARALQSELEKILAGEPPYDIFVRWKPLHQQPIGWEPDINDGVRLNIRPFLMAKDVGRKGAGILRFKPNIKWTKDRGKEPYREKADFPWFWGWDEQTQDFTGGTGSSGDGGFDGNRWNDLYYTNKVKLAARQRAATREARE
jgi:hypothetical protein